MNFNLHFGELHSNNSINDKNNLFENYIPECNKVKRFLISFNCFSEYRLNEHVDKITFKMETLWSALQMIQKGCFFRKN